VNANPAPHSAPEHEHDVGSAAAPACGVHAVHYRDIAATVHFGHIPHALIEELPALYSSIFSTWDYITDCDSTAPAGACVLEDPRHIILFDKDGDTLEILNKVFPIDPNNVIRASRALFRAYPHSRRIHLEVLFPPERLPVPKRVLHSLDHMVVDLPETIEEYRASLGKSTRRTIRSAENRLRRDFPDMRYEMVTDRERMLPLLRQMVDWKVDHFRSRGLTTYWETNPGDVEGFHRLLLRQGEAHVTSIEGRPAAILFDFPVGKERWPLQAAYDPAYERYRLGLLTQFQLACNAIDAGASRLNLQWTSEKHKQHFGARPCCATTLSLFRRPVDRLLFVDEAREIASRRLRQNGARHYWRARHKAGAFLRSRGLMARGGSA
jgi:hypothetical protein